MIELPAAPARGNAGTGGGDLIERALLAPVLECPKRRQPLFAQDLQRSAGARGLDRLGACLGDALLERRDLEHGALGLAEEPDARGGVVAERGRVDLAHEFGAPCVATCGDLALPCAQRLLELAPTALEHRERAALDLLLIEAAVEDALECEAKSGHGRSGGRADGETVDLVSGDWVSGDWVSGDGVRSTHAERAVCGAAAGPRLPAPSAAIESSISARKVRGSSVRSLGPCLRNASMAPRMAMAASTSGLEPRA